MGMWRDRTFIIIQFVLFGRWFMDGGVSLTQASYLHVPARKHAHHLGHTRHL